MVPFEKRATQQYLLSKGFPFNAVESDSSSTAAVSPSTRRLVTRKTTPSLRSLFSRAKVREEVGLGAVGAGQRVGAHHGPVDVLRNVIEESLGSSVLQVGEESSDIVGLERHSASPFWWMSEYRQR
jgi:hypothetical protein